MRSAGRRGVFAPDELIAVFGLNRAGCCGRCAATISRYVALATEAAVTAAGAHPRELSVAASA